MMKSKWRAVTTVSTVLLGAVIWFGVFSGEAEVQTPQFEASLPIPTKVADSNTADKAKADFTDTGNTIAATEPSPVETTLATDPAVDEKLASLEDKIRQLQEAMDDLMGKVESRADLATDPAVQKELQELSEQKEQLAAEYIDSTFASEPTDPAFDAEANAKISNGLQKIESLSSSVVQCASTMCRINTVASGEGKDAMAVMHALNSEVGWEGQMRVTVNHQTGETTAYLVKPGNTLPQVTN